MSTEIKVWRICAYCGREFIAQKTTTKYCGHPCATRACKTRVWAEKIQVSNLETREICPYVFTMECQNAIGEKSIPHFVYQ